MLELYRELTKVPSVNLAKASKILHFKRPHLYPILDSRLAKLYRESATQAAQEYPDLRSRTMYWAAVRNDVILNEVPLHMLRGDLASVESPFRMDELTDVRILDILSWSR